MTPLRVGFDLTREDYERTIQTVLESDPFTRRAWRKVKWLLAMFVGVLVAGTGWVWAVVGNPPVGLVVVTVLMFAWAVAAWPNARKYRRTAMKYVASLLAKPAGRAYLGPRTVEVGRDGLTITSRYGSSTVRWDGVFDVIRTPNHMFLVIPGPGYLSVPRSAFEYDEDFARYCDAVADLAEAARPAEDDPIG